MMWQVVYGIAALVACLLAIMVMVNTDTKLGYDVELKNTSFGRYNFNKKITMHLDA